MSIAFKRFCAIAVFTAGMAGSISCVQNPITGKSDFAPFMPSKDEQIAVGLQAAPQFESQSGGKFTNQAIQNYVASIGAKILAVVPPADKAGYKFSYTVVNDSAVNAFALPGGPIYITQGLLFKLDNEAQLVFVLGHETGHVIAQHVGRQMSKATELQMLMSGASAAAGDKPGTVAQLSQAAANYAGQLYLLSYSRDEERQADQAGLQYMVAAGYDPAASIQVMKILDAVSGGSKGSDWTATHPNPGNRIELLNGTISAKYASALNNPQRKLGQAEFHAAVRK